MDPSGGFERMCRTCMSESPALMSIFERQPGVSSASSTIGGMLRLFTTIDPTPVDGLPPNVCLACLTEINRAISFKEKSERSERTLQMCLRQLNKKQLYGPDDDNKPLIKSPEKTTMVATSTASPARVDEDLTVDNLDTLVDRKHNEQLETAKNRITRKSSRIADSKSRPLVEVAEDDQLSHKDPDGEEYYILDLKDDTDEAEYVEEEDMLSDAVLTVDQVDADGSDEAGDDDNDVNDENESAGQYEGFDDDDDDKIDEETAEDTAEDNDIDSGNAKPVRLLHQAVPISSDGREAAHQCTKCSAAFINERSLRTHQHINKCTQPTFECSFCQRVFVHLHNMERHQRDHHSSAAVRHTCSDCGRFCHNADALRLHREQRHPNSTDGGSKPAPRSKRCPHCSKMFSMQSSLRDHLRTHSGERPFLCALCGKSFTQKTNLRQHMLRHTQTKQFQCPRCPKAFVSKGELGQHELSHTGAHPFACETCGSGFTTSSSLAKHRRIHTGERPYACEYCPMRFAALGTLKNHRRTHTGERPFQCELCDKTFTQRSDCVSHQRLHAVTERFACSFCERIFTRATSHRAHEEKHRDLISAGSAYGTLMADESAETIEMQVMRVDDDDDENV